MLSTVVVVGWTFILVTVTLPGATRAQSHYGLSVIHKWKRRKFIPDTLVPNLRGNQGVHLQGYLVQAHRDKSACDLSRTSPPPVLRRKPKDLGVDREKEESWFLLAKRKGGPGDCPIEDQILHAQTLGYKAIIIVAPGSSVRRRRDLQRTIESSVSIYASVVGERDGLVLESSTFKECRGCLIEILTLPLPSGAETLAIDICLTIVLVSLYAIVQLVDWVWNKGLKVCKSWWGYKRRSMWTTSSPEATCGICLEGLGLGRNRRTLSCGHAFHGRKCIDVWLRMGRRNCPICRAKV